MTLSDIQQRLAVASERNRRNIEQRDKIMAEIKEKYGCSSVSELEAYVRKKTDELAAVEAELAEVREKAEKALLEIEAAVAGK